MSDNNIREIIDALNDGLDLCIALEKANTEHVGRINVIEVEDGLLNSKNLLYDLLNEI
jgi:hypothetical protein